MTLKPENPEYLKLTEEELKEILEKTLSNDFIIEKDKPGFHLLEQRKVVIDYLLYPKKHLIDSGFDDVWFGCEVKSPVGKKEAHKKLLDFAKQSIDYTESDFEGTIPVFVLMFPSMSHFFGDEGDGDLQHAHYFCHLFRAFIQRFKVGTLSINHREKWSISFGSQRYYSKTKGRSKVVNLGKKRHIGSK